MDDEKDDFNAGKEISTTAIILSLGIGMIVYNGLVLPVMGISAGWIPSIWVNIFVGFISYYTASLIITHLGIAKSMKDSILNHFDDNYSYMRAYGFINWLSFIPLIFLNFNFVALEIQGMLGYKSPWVAPILAIFMIFLIIFVRIMHLAEEAQALGIIGVICYSIFLIWAWITAPPGTNQVPTSGSAVVMAGSLITML